MNPCLYKFPSFLWYDVGVYREQMKLCHSNFCLFLLNYAFSHFSKVSHFPPCSYKRLASVCLGSSHACGLLLTKADGDFPYNPFPFHWLACETQRAYWRTRRHTTAASERSPRRGQPRTCLPMRDLNYWKLFHIWLRAILTIFSCILYFFLLSM